MKTRYLFLPTYDDLRLSGQVATPSSTNGQHATSATSSVFPPEIWHIIFDFVTQTGVLEDIPTRLSVCQTLSSLAVTCKVFHAIVTPILYHHVVLQNPTSKTLNLLLELVSPSSFGMAVGHKVSKLTIGHWFGAWGRPTEFRVPPCLGSEWNQSREVNTFVASLPRLSNLRSLELYDVLMTDIMLMALTEIPALTTLSLERTTFWSARDEDEVQGAQRLPRLILRSLRLLEATWCSVQMRKALGSLSLLPTIYDIHVDTRFILTLLKWLRNGQSPIPNVHTLHISRHMVFLRPEVPRSTALKILRMFPNVKAIVLPFTICHVPKTPEREALDTLKLHPLEFGALRCFVGPPYLAEALCANRLLLEAAALICDGPKESDLALQVVRNGRISSTSLGLVDASWSEDLLDCVARHHATVEQLKLRVVDAENAWDWVGKNLPEALVQFNRLQDFRINVGVAADLPIEWCLIEDEGRLLKKCGELHPKLRVLQVLERRVWWRSSSSDGWTLKDSIGPLWDLDLHKWLPLGRLEP